VIHPPLRPILMLALTAAALAACGKKPDFPQPPQGSPAARFYPNPALDPRAAPAVPPVPLPSARPAEPPQEEDARKPVDLPEPSSPAIPPGTATPDPGSQ